MIIRYFAPVAEAAGVDGWGRDRIGMLDILLISLLPGWSELELAHVEAVDHLLGGKVLHVPLVERDNWVIGVSYWKVRLMVWPKVLMLSLLDKLLLLMQDLVVHHEHIVVWLDSGKPPSSTCTCCGTELGWGGWRFEVAFKPVWFFLLVFIGHVWLVEDGVGWGVVEGHVSLDRLIFLLEDEVLVELPRIALGVQPKILVKVRLVVPLGVMDWGLAEGASVLMLEHVTLKLKLQVSDYIIASIIRILKLMLFCERGAVEGLFGKDVVYK